MHLSRLCLMLAVALILTACCCHEPEAGLRKIARCVDSIPETERVFVVVRATPLGERDEGKRQVLIESSVVSVRREGPIDAIDSAQRLDALQAPVWLAGTQVPDVTFGADSHVVAKPSIVTREAEEAVIETAESGPGVPASATRIETSPTYDERGALHLAFRCTVHRQGRLAFQVPPLTLEGPTGRVFIVEAARP